MSGASHPGPIAASERSLAPDLARGVMLLFIALANSHFFLPGSQEALNDQVRDGLAPEVTFAGFPTGLEGLDRVLAWLISTFVDERAYPLFGALFGYGVARIVARRVGAAPRAIRRLLWRRSAALVGLGLLHGLLLFDGDILAAYGVLLAVGAWAVGWKDATILFLAACLLLLTVAPDPGALEISQYAYVNAAGGSLNRLGDDLEYLGSVALAAPLFFGTPFLVGLWAGRRRLLEDAAPHRRALRAAAVIGIAVAAIGAQPVAVAVAGLTPIPQADLMAYFGPLHTATGTVGGLGYAALLALVALRLQTGDPGRLAGALAATGARSMTYYLAQSVVWFLVFSLSALGAATPSTVTGVALLAVSTWLATVVLAARMEAADVRGPFESWIRRLTYGRPAAGPAPER